MSQTNEIIDEWLAARKANLEVIMGNPNVLPPIEVPWWRAYLSFAQFYVVRMRRKLPYLVWHGDEIDVRVTFLENKMRARTLDEAMADLYSGSFYKAEKLLHEVGIEFDKGIGLEGRDWEWDWSLRGPISVKFVSRAQKPESRN